jgi:hypothetical protein
MSSEVLAQHNRLRKRILSRHRSDDANEVVGHDDVATFEPTEGETRRDPGGQGTAERVGRPAVRFINFALAQHYGRNINKLARFK